MPLKLLKNKYITILIIILIIVGGYFGYNKFFKQKVSVRYLTAAVKKDTLVVSVSGSGQISATNQVDIKPKVSGEIVEINVENGEKVKAGTLIAKIDDKDAQKAVRDAEINLENARLSLEKLKLDQELKLKTLTKSYEEGMDILADFYNELPTIMDNLKNIYFQTDLSSGQPANCNLDYFSLNDCNITYYANYGNNKLRFSLIPDQAAKLYSQIDNLYHQSKTNYQNVQRAGNNKERLSVIEEGRDIAVKLAEMIKIGRDVISAFQDILRENGGIFVKQNVVDEHMNSLTNYSKTVTNYSNNLLSVINSIHSYNSSLENLPLDLQTQELNLKQRQNALSDAKEKLADYYISAPFEGVIAKVNVKEGDTVSAGTVVATLISNQKIAEISLNEVDVAKVKIGQKATLTFDAIPDLTLTGKVSEIDTVGTVSQGVVSYNVKIVLDTDDERIKPGMSVTADIIVEAKSDVLVLPNSAIKSEGNRHYVELVEAPEEMRDQLLNNSSGITLPKPPKQKMVEIGISNGTMTEIVSGLKEGDIVVVSTISQETTTQTQTRTQRFQIPGMGQPQIRMR